MWVSTTYYAVKTKNSTKYREQQFLVEAPKASSFLSFLMVTDDRGFRRVKQILKSPDHDEVTLGLSKS